MCSDELNLDYLATFNYSVNADINAVQRIRIESKHVNWTLVDEKALLYLSPEERKIFFSLYMFTYLIMLFGNMAAIVVTSKRKQRYFQKTCIISLSLSDVITATAIMITNSNTFYQPLLLWRLGSFLCSLLPFLPVFGVVCSSIALIGIALDRYRNVVHALKRRWRLPLHYCLIIVLLAWLVGAGIACPMFAFFVLVPVKVFVFDHANANPSYKEDGCMCITLWKHDLMVYYISIICLVFVPLFSIFLWLYLKIALLVWKHRRPPSVWLKNNNESCVAAESSTPQTRVSDDSSKPATDFVLKSATKNRNSRVKRKIRTFKIIVFLMCTFLVLRLPNMLFDTIKLSMIIENHGAWIAKYICVFFNLLSCTLNPFLYTFLNKTMEACVQFVKTIKQFVCEVCCCCLSGTEFDEFENNNPFVQKSSEKENYIFRKPSKPKKTEIKVGELAAARYLPDTDVSNEFYREIKRF